MSRSLNKVELVGNLGSDPEIRATPNGGKVAQFSLATSRTWNDQAGVRQEKTEWHRCVVWNAKTSSLADIVERYVHKGDKLYVEGRIEYRQWQDKDGQTRYSTEINVRELILLGGRRDGSETGDLGNAGEDRGAQDTGMSASRLTDQAATSRARTSAPADDASTAATTEAPSCPKCAGDMWDNRASKRNPKAPDFKCKNRECDGVVWPPRDGAGRATPVLVRAGAASPRQAGGREFDDFPTTSSADDDDLPF